MPRRKRCRRRRTGRSLDGSALEGEPFAYARGYELCESSDSERCDYAVAVLPVTPASAVFAVSVACLVVSRADFTAVLLKHPKVALQVIRNLIRVARGLNENVRSLALLDVYGRVARVLMELAVEQDGKLVIPEKMTQKDIANRVGASREMINRVLRDLSQGGYVTIVEGRITINKAPPPRP